MVMFFLKYRLSESWLATLIVFAGVSAPVRASQIGCVTKPGSIKPRRIFLWNYCNSLSRTLFEEVGNSERNRFVISASGCIRFYENVFCVGGCCRRRWIVHGLILSGFEQKYLQQYMKTVALARIHRCAFHSWLYVDMIIPKISKIKK